MVRPGALARAADGTLAVVDHGAGLVYTLSPDGTWAVRAGTTSATVGGSGNLQDLALNQPASARFDALGRLWVAEEGSNQVRRFEGKTVVTVAGSVAGFRGNGGPAKDALFARVSGLEIDGDDVYVSDSGNGQLRKIGADGVVTRVIGHGDPQRADTTCADDLTPEQRIPADAYCYIGRPVVKGPDGLLYWANRGRQILRLNKQGSVELIAGKPAPAHVDTANVDLGVYTAPVEGQDPRTVTLLQVKDLAFSPDGKLYYTQLAGLQVHRIEGLDGPHPTVHVVAGISIATMIGLQKATPVGDGPDATQVGLCLPTGLCFDKAGNLYVGEVGTVGVPLFVALTGEHLSATTDILPTSYARVRKIAPDGQITTIAGPGGRFFTDPHADDALVVPAGLAIAPDGRLAICDAGANHIAILPAGSY